MIPSIQNWIASNVVELITLLIAGAALALSWVAFYRTNKFREFEYEQRIQVTNEHTSGSTSDHDTTFAYRANLDNRGLKPVKINSIWIDYGHETLQEQRYKYHERGHFYLRPGDSEQIVFRLSDDDFNATLLKFEIEKCHFFLRIESEGVDKKTFTKVRALGGIGKDSATLVVHGGEIL